jgi:hypothetical protein
MGGDQPTKRNTMKTVFNNRELCHIFASQSQDEGRGSNMSFRGDTLFSYSTAIFKIGKFKGKQYLLVNSTSYSTTTSKHKSYAWSGLHHIEPTFRIEAGRRGEHVLDLSPKEIVKYWVDRGNERSKDTHKLRRIQYEIFIGAKGHYEEAIRAAEFFGMGTSKMKAAIAKLKKLAEPFKADYEKFHAASEERREKAAATRRRNEQLRRAEEIAQQQAMVDAFLADHTTKELPARWLVPDDKLEAYEAQLKKREEWMLEQKKELMEAWMGGQMVSSWELRDLPVRLRPVSTGGGILTDKTPERQIETSHGAVIPYEDGKRCFRFAMKMNDRGWKRNGEQFKVGPYHLDAINEFGIIAGCHRIEWAEILRFAKAEGWLLQSTEAEAAQ